LTTEVTVIHEESSAPAHPSRETDDVIEAHYSGLERLECALCYRGLVYIGHLVEEDGVEVERVEGVPCRRCRLVDSTGPGKLVR
jgi:hypothetical protein